MKEFKFEFGAKVRDKVTGFEGVVTARCEYMTGCIQYVVVPTVDKDGKEGKSTWMDEARMELVPVEKEKIAVVKKKDSGGPQNHNRPV